MFIYKITVNTQIYIGFDSKPSYKLSRWKEHCNEANTRCKTPLHKAMKEYGITNCTIEVLEDNIKSLGDLALAEINYIKKYNSYVNGLNATPGGDGLGKHNLLALSNDDITKIKVALGSHFSKYNQSVKWANTSEADRKLLTQHLHTNEIYEKKSKTLKEYYNHNPDSKKSKSISIKEWQQNNADIMKAQNKINGLIGAEKVSKKLRVETSNGEVLHFNSKSEFRRITGQWANTIIEKTNQGLFYNGFKAWETHG